MLKSSTIEELLRSRSGRTGSLFFAAMIVISIYVVATYPLDFGVRLWSNPVVWADNPKAAPPIWANLFTSFRRAEHFDREISEPEVIAGASSRTNFYSFTFDYQADEPPTFTSFSVSRVTFHGRSPTVSVRVIRPDQAELLLYSFVVPGPSSGEQVPFQRYRETPLRVGLSSERTTAVPAVADFARSYFGIDVNTDELARERIEKILFGLPQGEGFRVLKGVYSIQVAIELYDQNDSVGSVRLVLGGSSFGLLGTDALGRDLAVGVLFGFPVALSIGLITSTITTLVGALLGILSGYVGGRTDTLIQRTSDVMNNIPLLPILIFLTFLLRPSLWLIILILVVFGWPGLTVIIRSMALQIRSAQFVEAAQTLGAPKRHIILRHIFPQTAPYVLAQLIFLAPVAILAEAALSFLGLGDPTIPTWGQILESGFRSGGVYIGFWWWVLPPGLLIVFTAMTFVLISLGLEPVVNPKLRKIR